MNSPGIESGEKLHDFAEDAGPAAHSAALQAELSALWSGGVSAADFAGVGVDLARVERIRQAVERDGGAGEAFVEKVYRPTEIEYCRAAHFPHERFAALWAVREAAVKALGTGYADGVGFHDLEIDCVEGRPPELKFHARFAELAAARGIVQSRVTLSHDRDYVIAVVVLLTGEASMPGQAG